MQFLNSLLSDNKLVTLGAALAAFLVFAVLVLLLVRLIFGSRLRMTGGRARQQRLGVVDAYDMDRQRQLVLVRRDNIEHLIMIGGPNDLLIESAILRVEARDLRERGVSSREGGETARLPVPETWSTADTPEPALAPPAPSMPSPAADPVPRRAPTAPPPAAPPTLAASEPAPAPEASPPSPNVGERTEPKLASSPETPLRPLEATPAKEPPRIDVFAKLRGRGTPPVPPPAPASAPSPAPAPADADLKGEATTASVPPADADFFETEIAKALAPSLRGRPAATPDSTPTSDGSAAPLAPSAPVRQPFRPFPPRRDVGTDAPGGSTTGLPPRPVFTRPPPPPFFSRVPGRGGERAEPGSAPEPSKAPPTETAPAAAEPLAATADRVNPPEPAIASPAPAREPSVPMPPPLPEGEPADPFEEEMARLLGRSPQKDG